MSTHRRTCQSRGRRRSPYPRGILTVWDGDPDNLWEEVSLSQSDLKERASSPHSTGPWQSSLGSVYTHTVLTGKGSVLTPEGLGQSEGDGVYT